MGKFTYLLIALIAVALYFISVKVFGDGEITEPIPDFYWGPKTNAKSKSEDVKIHPFKINIEDKLLLELKSKLTEEINSTRKLTPPLEGIGFEYGFNTKYLNTVLNYWLTQYDWKKREALLNKYPQFKTKIAGINIHFQHVKSTSKSKYRETRPLLLLHGWPGSFVEMQQIIPLLTDPKNSEINFELIIPSLPGYGFSEGAVRPGLSLIPAAQIFVKLMERLGHNKFYVQGGDWGHFIASAISVAYPKNVIAMHSNLCVSNHPRSVLRGLVSAALPSVFMTPEEADRFLPFSKHLRFLIEETGYLHIQGTKPDTIGVALSHSPSGLAAYILEKFAGWTDLNLINQEDGGLSFSAFHIDELLDNVMVYWVTSSITTSMRFYSENIVKFLFQRDNIPVKVPVGCLVAKHEPYTSHTRAMVEDKYQNLISYNYVQKGGHFIAMEHPQLLADDVLNFVTKVETIISTQVPASA